MRIALQKLAELNLIVRTYLLIADFLGIFSRANRAISYFLHVYRIQRNRNDCTRKIFVNVLQALILLFL
jgi:hypothetical protein